MNKHKNEAKYLCIYGINTLLFHISCKNIDSLIIKIWIFINDDNPAEELYT